MFAGIFREPMPVIGVRRVILQGRTVSPQERSALKLPPEGDMISVDRSLIRAIKDML